jgi:2-polyprenyl-3-methyl-5-hydroxy-6-metoxy-1,4-benzoquinol methylase
MKGAVDFHETNADDFTSKYLHNPDFKERFDLWSIKINEFLNNKGNILDIGCGPGLMSEEAAKINKSVTAFDGSEAMIALCKKNQKLTNINYEIGFIPNHLENFKSKEFDGVISSSVLEYIPEIEGTLKLINKVSAKDSIFILSLPNGSSWYRIFERSLYNIFGRPRYLKHVHNVLSLGDFINLISKHGFKLKEHHYYASHYKMSSLLKLFLPLKKRANLILYILEKKTDI